MNCDERAREKMSAEERKSDYDTSGSLHASSSRWKIRDMTTTLISHTLCNKSCSVDICMCNACLKSPFLKHWTNVKFLPLSVAIRSYIFFGWIVSRDYRQNSRAFIQFQNIRPYMRYCVRLVSIQSPQIIKKKSTKSLYKSVWVCVRVQHSFEFDRAAVIDETHTHIFEWKE